MSADLSAALAALDGTTVVPHSDADGLAAGAIALRALGAPAAAAVLLRRGQTPWDRDAPLPAGPVAVLDWGARKLDRAGLIVDHHAPECDPSGPELVVISGYGERPETTTAALMRRLVPEAPAWVAAVGAYGDLGARGFALPECAGAPRLAVRRLVPLVNAPRRVPDGSVRTALTLLTEAPTAADALADERIAELEDARGAFRAALDSAMRVAPSVGADAALIHLTSPYQVHPVVATAWTRRLAPRVVVAANDGYLPDRVNFSIRGGDGNLRELLRRLLPDVGGEYAHGHDRATGGSLAPADFDRLRDALGVPA